jgi:hypothetical protein
MLQIYFSRKLALFATIICAGGLFMCVFALNRLNDDTPLFASIMFWIMIPAMIWGVIAYLMRLLNPPLMMRVDRRGVIIFCDTTLSTIPKEGVFLPWDIVSDMVYEERKGQGQMTNRSIICIIKCTLFGDAPFPVDKHSVGYLSQDGNNVVCLDAYNGNISKQAMLDQIKPFWQSAKKRQSP